MGLILRKYQRIARSYAKRFDHPALFLDKRLGKSIVALRGIGRREILTGGTKILIVSPYSALLGWKKELFREGISSQNLLEITGSRRERADLLSSDGNVLLINTDGYRAIPEIAYINFTHLIFDESTLIKNPTTKLTKFYCSHFRNVKHRFILSGDPMPESMLDLYSQLQFLDPDILKVKNWFAFRSMFFKRDYFDPYKYHCTANGYRLLNKLSKDRLFFLSRKDVKLGGIEIKEKREFELSKRATKTYKKLLRDLILMIDEKIIRGFSFHVEIFHVIRRLFGGMVDGKLIDTGKYNLLKHIINYELPKEQLVIWAEYIEELKLIQKILKDLKKSSALIYGDVAVQNREKIINNFNKKQLDVLVCQPCAVKYGSDFSQADTQIYWSTPISHLNRSQSKDRIISTKKDSTLTIDFICKDTIEEDIYNKVMKKATNQELSVNILKRGSLLYEK